MIFIVRYGAALTKCKQIDYIVYYNTHKNYKL